MIKETGLGDAQRWDLKLFLIYSQVQAMPADIYAYESNHN